ncbi:MAG TPA: thiol-activated cytolysin family protein [Spirochaetota bacterium]|nr:thiol-activated cytolysin family protein [Spirochaetota bacterium]HPY02693.1 thiol-activated cytolysin family protein [Spirochaetota bacterium]HQA51310.1 thiol-activated cytolysin family protein [Spirochaetota bacterium]
MRYFKVLSVLLLASLFFSMPSEAGLIKKIKNKVTGKEEKKEEKNTPVKKDPKATAPNKALIKQLEALSNPEGINNNVKPQSLKETPLSNPVEESRKQTITSDGTPITYITTKQKFKASAAFDQQILLNPSSDVIYPGSVLLGHTIESGTYQEVSKGTKRPITISYDLTNIETKEGKAGKVKDTYVPSLSGYRTLHNKIMNQNLGTISTTYSFEATEIFSESDFGVKFNFGVGFNSGVVETNIKSGFDFNTGSNKRKYMVKFMETFYTVDVDQGPGTFLYDSFDIKDFKGYRPVYVSTISYGRLAYLTIESEKSWNSIKTSLEAEIDAKVYGKYNADLKVDKSKSESKDQINVTVIGAKSVVTNLDGFMNMLVTDKFSKENTGKIIAYKLRFVDDNSVANTVYNDEYTLVKTTDKFGEGIQTTFTLYKIKTNANDGNGKELELYGNIDITDGKRANSFWSLPRSSRKKYKEKGEATENASFTYIVPNENSSFDLTLQLFEADGSEKDDDRFTNAMGAVEGNMAKKIIVSDLKDGQDLVIKTNAIKKGKKKDILSNEWVEFYIKVNKKYLY